MFCLVFLISNRYYKAYSYKTLITLLTFSQKMTRTLNTGLYFFCFVTSLEKNSLPERNRVFVRDGTQYILHYDFLWCLT